MGILRLYLALVVLVSHFAHILPIETFISGGLAVRAFYLISGFYIQVIITDYMHQPHWKRRFYLSRALRLFPTYYLLLALTVMYNGTSCNTFCVSMVTNQAWGSLAYYYISNFFIIGQDVSRFLMYHYSNGTFSFDPHTSYPSYWVSNMQIIHQGWSIAVELDFYLIAPFLLTRKTGALAMVCVACYVLRWVLAEYGYKEANNWYNSFFPSSLHPFTLGALAARIAKDQKAWSALNRYMPASGLVFLMMWLASRGNIIGAKHDVFLLWGLFCFMPYIFLATQHSRYDRWLGSVSYPVYLNHMLVITIMGSYVNDPLLHLLASILVSLLFGLLIVILIEHPLVIFRHKHFRAAQAQGEHDISYTHNQLKPVGRVRRGGRVLVAVTRRSRNVLLAVCFLLIFPY